LAQGAQGSPVTEAIAAAVTRTAGVALGGAATFIPLLERCGTETLLQARRAPVQACQLSASSCGLMCSCQVVETTQTGCALCSLRSARSRDT